MNKKELMGGFMMCSEYNPHDSFREELDSTVEKILDVAEGIERAKISVDMLREYLMTHSGKFIVKMDI